MRHTRQPSTGGTLRPIDLAREHGLSTQAVRNYEDAGVLPAAGRRPSGYRSYTDRHAAALRAFLALVAGHGHAAARAIMAAAVEGRIGDALELVDRGHVDLLDRRRVLDGVQRALAGLSGVDGSPHGDDRPIPVGALAHRVGLRPATLRRWERAGLLRPARDRAGHRLYGAADVRDAHVIRELRRGGHPLARIGPLLDELRDAGNTTALADALAERREALTARARAMLRGAGLLDAFLAT
ncbi:MerR family transcriptional regulator [Pseudonocardia endophytica]|uniref:DNA-binding transcriptional MerR regulator n=1 Tax=Pseudonocardia endophytica TaxID=401976 RepID=A0A4R1HXV5_PSEEN|nr:MerR family transcriptional regulator [Pseudonocardia endophytica]TCK25955.1 DNA-binding transcriptional MerR regulator [Pseudonocardia endophytica]